MKRSKAYRAAAEKINPDELYSPLSAVRLVKAGVTTKFDPTVEVSMRLGVDPRKADQMVRGTVNLPHGTGKTARVLVFATGDRAEAARAAGAEFVGSDDLIERIQGGFLDFDAVVATPDLMGKVGRLGFITPMTHNFCESCNRVRLTCTGTLYMCLGQEDAADLRAPLRASEGNELLNAAIDEAIERKPKGHDFVIDRRHNKPAVARHMSVTGG